MKKSLLTLMLLCFAFIGVSNAQQTITIGNLESTNATYNVPYNSLYGFSYIEQLYTAEEIADAGGFVGTVETLRFYHKPSTTPTAALTNNIVVYMVNTDQTTFPSWENYVPVTADDIVFEGDWTIPVDEGWVDLVLQNPFYYDGTSSIMVGVHETTAGYSSRYFIYTNVDNTVCRFYSDGNDPDPYNLDTYAGTKGVVGTRANIQMDIVPATSCLRPDNLVVSNITTTNALITWESDAANFNVEYKKATEDTWVRVTGPITTPSYIFMFLDPETDYNARVQAVCDDEESPWKQVNFSTPATCPAPTDLIATLMPGQGTVATLSWTDNGDETTDWQICLNEDEDNLISFSIGGATYMFTDLIPETTYTAKVRANCGDEDGVSEWSNTVTFTPTNAYTLTVNEGTNTNDRVPIYGYWCDSSSGVRSQFIIPAANLASIQWATINTLTFYSSDANISWGDANFEVYMTEVENTTFDAASLVDWISMEKVMDAASLAIVDGEMVVTLSAPYQYLGGNLLIGFNQTVKGSYKSCHWYGVTDANAAIGGYGSGTTISLQNFLPKTTFDYTPGEPPACMKPTQLAVSGVTNHEATLSWTSDAAEWVVEYDVAEDFSTMLTENVTGDPTWDLTGLDASTVYFVRVKAVCDEGDSDYSSVLSFNTKCDPITTFPWNEDFTSFDAGVFDALCWVNEHISGAGAQLFTITDEGGLYLPDMSDGTMTKLALPGMTLPNDNYMFSLAVYRNTSYSNKTGEGIRVFVSTDGEIEGATELAFIPRVRTVSNDVIPAENYDGFFTYHLPIGISGTCYIILRGESQYGTATYMGEFAVEEIPTFTKTIEGHHGEEGHYYLIASPVRTIAPTAVEGLIAANEDDYDLYYFDQEGDAEGKEWINYKPAPFNLEWSKGYLYASKEDTELVFKGAPHFTLTSACSLELDYVDGAEFAGFNLVGNPYAEDAVMNIRTFYTLRGTADFVAQAPGSVVHALEGVAVIATSEGEYAEFYLDGKKSANAALNVSQNGNLIDRAIMSFEGQNLPKIQLNPNHTKVYMPVEGKDFAVASVESFGEMPVNFKAENDGSFTMDFTSEEVGFSYLHLIDNLTGADVDLLANPSYSFDAKNSDYASRFKLVFVVNEDNLNNNDNFAFVSNGNIIVNGEGMLQVIDMTGRVISTNTINGVSSISVDAAAGVYVLQLSNGNEVKTQKIVVK